jgi:hypothetical protein
MSPEDMSFALWQMEQHELKRVKEALRQADSGRLVPHLTVRQLFPLRPTPDASVAVYGRVSPKINISWSDAVVADLRSSCEYFEQCSSGIDFRDHALDGIFSTVEIIANVPTLAVLGEYEVQESGIQASKARRLSAVNSLVKSKFWECLFHVDNGLT